MICCNTSLCPPATAPYSVVLQGPFGLVLHKDPNDPSQITGLTAFMPVDDHGRHKFRIQRQDQNTSRSFGFAIQQITPPKMPKLCVGPGFCDFCVESFTPNPNAGPKLVTIELSIPTRIITKPGETPLRVVFRSTKSGSMPRTFILEYDLAVSPLQFVDTTSGLSIPLPSNGLLFEVGLDPQDPDDPFSSHALHFYNGHLLPFFGLQNDNDHVITSIFPSLAHSVGGEDMDATTLECKAGGIIGGTTP